MKHYFIREYIVDESVTMGFIIMWFLGVIFGWGLEWWPLND